MPETRRKTGRILKLLESQYGLRPRRRGSAAVDVLVATILSQNTSSNNSSAAFRKLKDAFSSWDAVADAPVGRIADRIRVSGLSRRKAPRIRKMLRQVRAERGRVSLKFLGRRTAGEAYDYLLRFDGVGPKTALCVLLFSFGMRVFPVDTHICRIARRLGLLDSGTPAERAHEVLTVMIAPRDRYAMHLLLIEHGREICAARRPRCAVCCLLSLCRYGRKSCGR